MAALCPAFDADQIFPRIVYFAAMVRKNAAVDSWATKMVCNTYNRGGCTLARWA
jgi:hypothetical protein